MAANQYLESALELIFGDADDDDAAIAQFIWKYGSPEEADFARHVRDEWAALLSRNDEDEALELAQRALHSDYFENGNEALAWLRVHYYRVAPAWEKLPA